MSPGKRSPIPFRSSWPSWPCDPVRLLAVLAVLAALLGCGGQGGTEREKTLRVGLLISEGETLSGLSRAYRNVGELVRVEAAETGGVQRPGGGRAALEVRVYAHGEDVESSLRALRLAASEGCQAIVGGALSRQALPMAALAEELRVPLISPGSTHPDLVGRRAYVFRTPYSDSFQSKALARLCRDGGRQTAAVFFNRTDVYASNLADGFVRAFRALGGRVLAEESYTAPARDLAESLRPVVRARPEVVFLTGYYSEIPEQARALRALGFTGDIVGPDAWDLLSGDQPCELYGARFLVCWHAGAPQSEASRAFLERFTARFGRQPTSVEALVRDAFGLVFQAAGRAQELDAQSLRLELARVTEFHGVAGRALYHDGTPERDALVMEVSSRGLQYVQTITPEAVARR